MWKGVAVMQFYLLKLICLCFAAVVIFITQQVSDTEAHVEQHIGPLNVPNDYGKSTNYSHENFK